jgi:GTP cyclohydrolase FolE2
MRIQHALVCIAVVLAVSTSATFASPCSQEIDRVQAGIDAKLEAQAAAGRSASESTSATMHRQPTPGSIAAAEAQLGDISPEELQAAQALMTQAREADRAGDQSACE